MKIGILIFLLSFFTAAAVITSAWDVCINKKNKGIKKITKRGYLLLLIGIAITFLPLTQYLIQINNDNKKDKKVKSDQELSEKLMKNHYDSLNKITVATIAENLGKYGYKLDSANNALKKVLSDSAKTKVILPENPVFQIISIRDENGLKSGINYLGLYNNKYNYQTFLNCFSAGSCCYDLKFSLVVLDSLDGYTWINWGKQIRPKLINYQSRISTDTYITKWFSIGTSYRYNMLYLWLRGTYKNLDQSKEFSIDEVYYNNKNGNHFGLMQGITRQEIIDIVNKNEK